MEKKNRKVAVVTYFMAQFQHSPGETEGSIKKIVRIYYAPAKIKNQVH
jgi:hypothetical protein